MTSTVFTVFMPIALGLVMFGLGLTLTVADFARVLKYPKAAAVALTCQLVVLPAICYGLVVAFGLQGALAVGMMLLVASPGGITANLFSHLAGGDVALNITLTAINPCCPRSCSGRRRAGDVAIHGRPGRHRSAAGEVRPGADDGAVPVAIGPRASSVSRLGVRMHHRVSIASAAVLVWCSFAPSRKPLTSWQRTSAGSAEWPCCSAR